MPTWPVTLPQRPLKRGFNEQLQNNVTRTAMDAGPAKQRRRFTAGVTPFTVSFVMSEAQRIIFRDFFYDEIAGGAQRFDMPHPYDGDLVSFRIDMSAGPPSVSPEPGNRWLVSFTLEELP
tara:strand:+ start:4100 stop:4459 length:360 start_codon:yes stop_codon:yes gene_type:complete